MIKVRRKNKGAPDVPAPTYATAGSMLSGLDGAVVHSEKVRRATSFVARGQFWNIVVVAITLILYSIAWPTLQLTHSCFAADHALRRRVGCISVRPDPDQRSVGVGGVGGLGVDHPVGVRQQLPVTTTRGRSSTSSC